MARNISYKNLHSTNELLDKGFLIRYDGYKNINLDDVSCAYYKGYKNTRYIVTDKGDVFHCIPEYDIVKKVNTWDCKGYRKTSITSDTGMTYQFFVHRLIAFAMLPNPENKPEVNHINGMKSDNRLQNLEWCTRSENENHKKKLGYKVSDETKERIRQANKGGRCWRAKKVICIETGEIFDTAKQASFSIGMSMNTVSQACNSGRAVRGYHYQYI